MTSQRFLRKNNMQILDSKNFDSTLKSVITPIVLYFYAVGCGPCRAVSPIMDIISNDYGSALNVFKVNVDTGLDIATKYDIMSIPTLIFMDKNKNILKTTAGFNRFSGEEDIIRNIETIMV